MLSKKLLVLFICLLHLGYAKGNDYELNAQNIKAYQAILKLKLTLGEEYLSQMKSSSKSANGINLYLQSSVEVVKLMLTEDKDLYEKLKDGAEERIEQLEELNPNSPYHLFLRAEVMMQWAAVKYKFGDRLDGITDGMNAYKLLVKNEQLYPHFLPNKKSLGACKIMLGSVPKQMKKWIGLFGYKGNVKEGMADIKSVINSDSPYRIEAQFILAFIQSYVLGENDEAMASFDRLLKENPDSQLAYLASAAAAKHGNNSKKALFMLENMPKGSAYYELPFVDYLKAESCLQLGQYYRTVVYAKRFVAQYKGQNYLKDAYHKIFLAYWMLNDSRAWQYLELSKTKGTTIVVPDQFAQRFAEEKELPNKSITQARLYFDGGDFDKAIGILNAIDVQKLPRERDKIEYYYRKGRVLHLQKKYAQAMALYKNVLAVCPKEYPFYYGAASALQAGYIHRDIYKDAKSAKYFFKEVPTYTGHEYENSFENKAKAALGMMQ